MELEKSKGTQVLEQLETSEELELHAISFCLMMIATHMPMSLQCLLIFLATHVKKGSP